jgi:hypothetical protein
MSKKPKGISAEEKRIRVMDVFQVRKDVFQMKELEKIVSKEKQINSMIVKELVQGLVDEGLVDAEKIGSSWYYWAFPSKLINAKKQRLDELRKKVTDGQRRMKYVTQELEEYEINAEDELLRSAEEEKLKMLKSSNEKLRKEVDKLKDFDPAIFSRQKEEIDIAKEAAERWTDNVFALKAWCRDKANMEPERFHSAYGIPEDLDYPE